MAGPFWGDLELAPGRDQIAWLVLIAAAGQVAGWLLVAMASPHLLLGCGLVLASGYVVSSRRL